MYYCIASFTAFQCCMPVEDLGADDASGQGWSSAVTVIISLDCSWFCKAEPPRLCSSGLAFIFQGKSWQVSSGISLKCETSTSYRDSIASASVQIHFHAIYLNVQLDCFHPSLIAHQNMAKALATMEQHDHSHSSEEGLFRFYRILYLSN